MPKYPKEQIWKIYQNLPEELKEAIFSEETAENIYSACERNGVDDPFKISQVARWVGEVLMGLLPPASLEAALKSELKLKADSAKKIAFEITRFVFYPLRETLAALYQMEMVSPASLPQKTEATGRKTGPGKKDLYREQVEES